MINEKLKRDYGVTEVNPLPSSNYHDHERIEYIQWGELKQYAKDGHTITCERVRFVTDLYCPFWELSYCHMRISGKEHKGIRYRIADTPFYQVPKRGMKKKLYDILKKEGIFIKGFFDNLSLLYP